jgi:hypothetical protein
VDEPLVPVTVTAYAPIVLELMVRVEEPNPPGLKPMLAGLMEAVRPVELAYVEKLIMPMKPATLRTVMDEVPEPPA